MPSVQLTPASLALLLHDLSDASDNDQSVELELGADGLKIKIGGEAAALSSRPHLYSYIDLSGCVLPKDEFDDLAEAPTGVVAHDEGAWLHVPYADDSRLDDEHAPRWEHFPHLRQVLIGARQLGARWINLDRDGVDIFEELPTFDH